MNSNIVWHSHPVDQASRAAQKSQRPLVIWFTGLSASGKSTIAGALEQILTGQGYHTYLLDGDNVRHGLCRDLGFGDADRQENIRRVGEVAKLMADAGLIVLAAFISPFRADRRMVRDILPDEQFVEVFVDAPLDTCRARDPKGLYAKADRGEIRQFTGIDSPYEEPEKPEVYIRAGEVPVAEAVNQLLAHLHAVGALHEGYRPVALEAWVPGGRKSVFLFKGFPKTADAGTGERPIRSLAKAVSWRVTGSIDTLLLSWFFTGDLGIAAAIGLTEVVTKMLLYYLHERAWSRVAFGHSRQRCLAVANPGARWPPGLPANGSYPGSRQPGAAGRGLTGRSVHVGLVFRQYLVRKVIDQGLVLERVGAGYAQLLGFVADPDVSGITLRGNDEPDDELQILKLPLQFRVGGHADWDFFFRAGLNHATYEIDDILPSAISRDRIETEYTAYSGSLGIVAKRPVSFAG